jgi:hypothetical protein
VRLLALRPLLAYCASLEWEWRWLWRSRWNVDWQGKPKFSEKTCPSATFAHYKIPHDETRVWTRAAAVGVIDLQRTTRCYIPESINLLWIFFLQHFLTLQIYTIFYLRLYKNYFRNRIIILIREQPASAHQSLCCVKLNFYTCYVVYTK